MAKDYFHKGVTYTTKSTLSDLLTEADIAVSDFLVNAIHKEYPGHHIASEELKEDVNPGADFEWVIDPIDGTYNFAHGIPMWCHLIAVMKDGEGYLGAAYNPIASELFFAEEGRGATLNGLPIRVNEKESLDYAVGSFSRAHVEGVYGACIERYRHALDRLNHETSAWMQHFGTVLGACYVASGSIDFFMQNSGLDHDYLAPVLMCREAGAIVTDSDGNPWKRGRQDIVIANPKLHPWLMELFQK